MRIISNSLKTIFQLFDVKKLNIRNNWQQFVRTRKNGCGEAEEGWSAERRNIREKIFVVENENNRGKV